jgi:hypothetical protein
MTTLNRKGLSYNDIGGSKELQKRNETYGRKNAKKDLECNWLETGCWMKWLFVKIRRIESAFFVASI